MGPVPRFDRRFFRSGDVFSRIGGGGLGGKAEGLLRAHDAGAAELRDAFRGVVVTIPRLVVLATDVFDAFMRRNGLDPADLAGLSDRRIAHAFQSADLPSEVVGDLVAVAEEATRPLAIRSSSRLEDALGRPFAGIYETKMIPNLELDPRARFARLLEAVKFVYASTHFSAARTYRRVIGVEDSDESMAVMIQEIVGARHGPRFYPHLSAVARSYSYYPIGKAKPEDGVVDLALGLGKTIVDGGVVWTYSPAHPRAPAPFASTRRVLAETQTRFWAVNMGRPPAYDPVEEKEYLVEGSLADAEADGALRYLASTYDASADRLRPGTGMDGPRVLNFAPLLELRQHPLNDVVRRLLDVSSQALGGPVEIELAATLPTAASPEMRMGLVQLRGMVAPGEAVDVNTEELEGADVLLASRAAMGNGEWDDVRDVVYVRPDRFEAKRTPAIAREVAEVNASLLEEGRECMLIGFGRWGSSDPWLGIPVQWSHVASARALVEATLPHMDVEPSQGSHFFHNLSSFGVLYFTVRHGLGAGIDWDWLDRQPALREMEHVRHVRLEQPLRIRVDGRARRGVVRRPEGER